MEESFIVICPHCLQNIIIEKVNCGIFRHGVLKNTGAQINPHLPKDACDRLKQNDVIYGCGKPFKLIKSILKKEDNIQSNEKNDKEKYIAVKCDYI